ncbi:MAG TPA: DNA-processing protein DprA [Candidatus Limnocylindrales bacterium]|nr:DNA-processing protein DprA [Candidatus Limnocylindrales bacterium]
MTADLHEQATLVAMLRTRPEGMTWPDITAEVVAAGCASQLWDRLQPPVLLARPGEPDPIDQAADDIRGWKAAGLIFTTVLDSSYPVRLRGIHEAPPVLFGRGDLRAEDVGVSVVGSRKASQRGLSMAEAIAAELTNRHITVIAGLAQGIDTAAHRCALDRGGRTVAIIGTGINRYYPSQNRELQDTIARNGLVLSQFWPDASPQKHMFLMRNATMSGYGIATIVVEAGETSGARAQARMAVEHGRPVILTDLVLDNNQWAKPLVGRPGVHIARSLRDVIGIVESLCSARAEEDEFIHQLIQA